MSGLVDLTGIDRVGSNLVGFNWNGLMDWIRLDWFDCIGLY